MIFFLSKPIRLFNRRYLMHLPHLSPHQAIS